MLVLAGHLTCLQPQPLGRGGPRRRRSQLAGPPGLTPQGEGCSRAPSDYSYTYEYREYTESEEAAEEEVDKEQSKKGEKREHKEVKREAKSAEREVKAARREEKAQKSRKGNERAVEEEKQGVERPQESAAADKELHHRRPQTVGGKTL